MEPVMINVIIGEKSKENCDLMKNYLNKYDFVNVVDTVTTGEDLIKKTIECEQVNGIISAFVLGNGKNGLDSYTTLKLRGRKVAMVIITEFKPDASYTYDLGITDLIEKPITNFRLEKALIKMKERIECDRRAINDDIMIPVINEHIIQLYPSEILFIESENKSIFVHTENTSMETRIPIKTYEDYLFDKYFYLTHRSTLVNLLNVDHTNGNDIYFVKSDKKAFLAADREQEFAGVMQRIKKVKEVYRNTF